MRRQYRGKSTKRKEENPFFSPHYLSDSLTRCHAQEKIVIAILNLKTSEIDCVFFRFCFMTLTDFEEAQQQQLKQQQIAAKGNNNGNPHWQEQFAQWNLNN